MEHTLPFDSGDHAGTKAEAPPDSSRTVAPPETGPQALSNDSNPVTSGSAGAMKDVKGDEVVTGAVGAAPAVATLTMANGVSEDLARSLVSPTTGLDRSTAEVTAPAAEPQPTLSSKSSTMQHATPVAGPSSPPESRPPYHCPFQLAYPPNTVPNPHYNSLDPKPSFPNIPSSTLYRPQYLPEELDERIDKRSIWIGVDKETAAPRYFVPASCRTCGEPHVRSHCDRGFPSCARCKRVGAACIPGANWRYLKIAKKDGEDNAKAARRVSASSPHGADKPTKRPRLSEPGASTRVQPVRIEPVPSTSAAAPPKRTIVRKRPLPGLPTADPAMTMDDRAYLARIEANNRKPGLANMKAPCPVWAITRRSLTSAVEYLWSPVKTAGASVEIAAGGMARGLILEGQSPAAGAYWGRGQRAGTIVAAMGKPRAIRKQTPPTTSTDLASPVGPASRSLPVKDEAAEIEALCMSHRTRTPVAIALGNDWSEAPFRVPRRFIVLGWFWVADAWVEPVTVSSTIEPRGAQPATATAATSVETVCWKFCFEWCRPQATPWWEPQAAPDRLVLPPNEDPLSARWPITGPTVTKTRTVRPSIHTPGTPLPLTEDSIVCRECQLRSRIVYQMDPMCLNESCSAFHISGTDDHSKLQSGVQTFEPDQAVRIIGISPIQLGYQIRPAVPLEVSPIGVPRQLAGKEYWRAWVCDVCGMANERRDWSEWDCGACGRAIRSQKTGHSAAFLRNPTRPVCTGPRQDDGSPIWSFPATMAWTLFKDDIKVVRHVVDTADALGVGAQVQHALSTEGKGSHIPAGLLLAALQGQVGFERQIQPFTTNRPSERYLSPFYTMSFGPDAPAMHNFPSAPPTPWKKSSSVGLDTIDLINERGGRMWPGVKERFNSLLLAAIPPELPTALQPRLYIGADEYFAFLFLGSDGEVKVKQLGQKGGEMKVQHGDVVGVKAGESVLEVVFRFEGLAFVGIARQVYTEDAASVESESADSTLRDADFPALPGPTSKQPVGLPRMALPHPEVSSTSDDPVRTESEAPLTASLAMTSAVASRAASNEGTAVSMPRMPLAESASTSAAKVAKTKKPPAKLLDKASPSGWYIGCRPLDPQDPLLALPVLDERKDVVVGPLPASIKPQQAEETLVEAVNGTDEDGDVPMTDAQPDALPLETRWKGVVQITQEDLDSCTDLRPPPLENAAKKALEAAKSALTQASTPVPAAAAKVKGKRKGVGGRGGSGIGRVVTCGQGAQGQRQGQGPGEHERD